MKNWIIRIAFKMKKYEILEHRADLRIMVFGKNKQEMFGNALLGMESGLRPKVKTQNSKVKIINIKSIDLTALLVDFLSEVLYLNQTSREIYQRVNFTKFSDNELRAELFGKKVEGFGEDIKAVTHHGLTITENNGKNWGATILFDI